MSNPAQTHQSFARDAAPEVLLVLIDILPGDDGRQHRARHQLLDDVSEIPLAGAWRVRRPIALATFPLLLGARGRLGGSDRSTASYPDRHGIVHLRVAGMGYFFFTDTLQMWHAMILLVVHGCAGVFWQTPSQLLLHALVEPKDLQSAVRLNATARYLGILVGPAVGGAMLHWLGPTKGIFLNACYYVPVILWLWRLQYRREATARTSVKGLDDVLCTIREIAKRPAIVTMSLLAAAASAFIGNSYQAQMPNFAVDLGHGDPGAAYSVLLAADAAGALTAGFSSRNRGRLQDRPTDRASACDGMVLRACRFRTHHNLPSGAYLPFQRGILRTLLQQHGTDGRADRSSRRYPRPRTWRLRHGVSRLSRLCGDNGRLDRIATRSSHLTRALSWNAARHRDCTPQPRSEESCLSWILSANSGSLTSRMAYSSVLNLITRDRSHARRQTLL